MNTHLPLNRHGTLAIEWFMDSLRINRKPGEQWDECCDADLFEGYACKNRYHVFNTNGRKPALLKESTTFSGRLWEGDVSFLAKINVKRGRQSLLMSQVLELGDYQTMFRSCGRKVEFGGFFCRPSNLRTCLLDILDGQHSFEPREIGISICHAILDCGGIDGLLEIWKDLLEYEIMYKIRLIDPFLF